MRMKDGAQAPQAIPGKRFPWEWFSGGVVLGIALASAWFIGAPALAPAVPQTSADGSSTTTKPVGSPSDAVAVSDQPAGNSVTIDSITVPPPGVWVAVREANGTALGNVLGAARAGGPRSDFVVSLLRPTQAGKTYAVEFYRDDGNGMFSVASDSVYVDFDSGQPVVDYFAAK